MPLIFSQFLNQNIGEAVAVAAALKLKWSLPPFTALDQLQAIVVVGDDPRLYPIARGASLAP